MTPTHSEVTEEQVARAVGGDGRAVAEIVRVLERPIYNVALRMLLDRQDAEDATQEALIRIVTRLVQFRGDSRFTTWAYRIAIRRILDFRDQRASHPQVTFDGLAADLADGLEADAVEAPENAIHHQQLKRLCGRAMLQCLDSDHRIAFILGELLDLTSVECAEILEIEPATFRKRLSRARTALTEFMNRNCGVVNPQAPCACHRRLNRAVALGRVELDDKEDAGGDVASLRAQLAALSEMQRAVAFYRNEAELKSKRDFVSSVRSMLERIPSAKEPS